MIPRHLAVIPDGNRRWARSQGLSVREGHAAGIANVGAVADAAFEAGVEVFSFWWGSPANLTKRSAEEVEGITGVLTDWLTDEGRALIARHDAQFDVYGRWEQLCPGIRAGVDAARSVSGKGPKRLVLLMAYDGREELAEAAASGARSVEGLGAAMWTASLPPVDLLIRTAGEPHLSAGFLLWHLSDAQLAFEEPPWPAFGTDDLTRVLGRYGTTERRFGR